MRVLTRAPGVRSQVRAWRAAGERVAFVPTMGYFHHGHLSLMRLGRRVADRVVVSIFVNPTQFGPMEDFARYPRDLTRDKRLAREAGVDLCYTPRSEEVYPPGFRTEVRVRELEDLWEGSTRPGHFAGVALVVLKLLHVTEPDIMILGQKDAQQAVVLETMIRDLDLGVKVRRAPIVRERDGLAMSSRNIYLSPEDRAAAPALRRALLAARRAVAGGERSARNLRKGLEDVLRREPRLRLDYAAVIDARTLVPLDRLQGRVLIPVAAWLGSTRLIDNIEFDIPGERSE